ncbi:MAG: hypothetical protein KIT48_12105 [Pseudolabrys sp.]|nr:hypothetical protein [Pseudolabrys sp.]
MSGEMESPFRELQLAQKRADRAAARAFIDACRLGDAEALFSAVDAIAETTLDGWRLAMLGTAALPSVAPQIQEAFLAVWIEYKMLALNVGHRPTLVRALRLLLPPRSPAQAVRLFRGTSGIERRHRLYGVSWTSSREIAETFARSHEASRLGGVVLEAVIEPHAILHFRDAEGHYDEVEHIVDAYKIRGVEVAARFQRRPAVASRQDQDFVRGIGSGHIIYCRIVAPTAVLRRYKAEELRSG